MLDKHDLYSSLHPRHPIASIQYWIHQECTQGGESQNQDQVFKGKNGIWSQFSIVVLYYLLYRHSNRAASYLWLDLRWLSNSPSEGDTKGRWRGWRKREKKANSYKTCEEFNYLYFCTWLLTAVTSTSKTAWGICGGSSVVYSSCWNLLLAG